MRTFLKTIILPKLLLFSCSFIFAQQLDIGQFEAMKARSVGPAGMSGRVTAIDVLIDNPEVIYAGTASGGLWRSESGGIEWEPIFDDQPCASIGAIAVNQTNPDVIWVGTGEGNPRNSQTSGCGVFRSLDGGRTWKHMGLKNTRNIHRLILHPHDPDIIWVGAQGDAWSEHEERGVFKTTDGGKTWKKILYAGKKVGVADLVIDPVNPNKLLCAMWEFRRWPWFFESGGPGSSLNITYDGGETWKKVSHEDGLPKSDLGRIGLAIAASKPDRVYALVESKKNALYRSDDGGHKWKKVSEKNIGNRPFYYADIYVDPQNENRIFNLYSIVTVSQDAGKTFDTLIPYRSVHPDHHAFWIHPHNPDFIVEGNDGGLAISRDGGANWRFIENLPLAQFYHIRVDDEIPYHIYGGMQDNGSWRGPSRVWRAGGIRNSYWREVGFGDGFDVLPDPLDNRYGYAMSQGGALFTYDRHTGLKKNIRPYHEEGKELRFNWNAGLAIDPHDQKTIYYGSQYLHASSDKGATWTTISDDLTSNDPEKQKQLESGGLTYDTTQAENFTTIVAIAPSSVKQGMIWVGSDDGLLHLTEDGGASWKSLSRELKGVPEGTWIPQIYPSTHSEKEAFVVLENHRRGDWTPYVYHTKNKGNSFKRLVGPGDVDGYALAIVQDPEQANLLFLGTEVGLYVSIDYGKTWTKWTQGVPTVSTMDLALQKRSGDLVLGTFGRSAFVLDDIRPLRGLAKDGLELLKKPIHIFPTPDAYQVAWAQADGTRFAADATYKGENRREGGLITFIYNPVPERKDGKDKKKKDDKVKRDKKESKEEDKDSKVENLKVEILDSDGKVIRTLQHEAKPGINRLTWNLDRKGAPYPSKDAPPKQKDRPEPSGPDVSPGAFTVRITNGEHISEAALKVHLDPRLDISSEALAQRDELLAEIYDTREKLSLEMDRLREAKNTIKLVESRLGDESKDLKDDLKEMGKETNETIDTLMHHIVQKEVQGILRDPKKLTSRMGSAMSRISSLAPVSKTDRQVAKVFQGESEKVLAEIAEFFKVQWPAYKNKVTEAQVSFFKE